MNKEQPIKGKEETVKSFLPVLDENLQAQIAGYYNDDKTDIEKGKRNAVIEEYVDLIAIYKNGYIPTPIQEGEERRNKDKEIYLLEAREVAWGNKVSELNEEIERLKGLITEAWQQAIINCEVENGAYEGDGHYIHFRQFKTENNIEDKAIYTGNSLK